VVLASSSAMTMPDGLILMMQKPPKNSEGNIFDQSNLIR
jgi:hypothetical protein